MLQQRTAEPEKIAITEKRHQKKTGGTGLWYDQWTKFTTNLYQKSFKAHQGHSIWEELWLFPAVTKQL